MVATLFPLNLSLRHDCSCILLLEPSTQLSTGRPLLHLRRTACEAQENLLQGIDSIAHAFLVLVAHLHPDNLTKASPIESHKYPSLRISFQT
jgi:hypothetical protein